MRVFAHNSSMTPLMTPLTHLPAFELTDSRGTLHRSQTYQGAPLVIYFIRDPKKIPTMAMVNAFHESKKDFHKQGVALLGMSARTQADNAQLFKALALNHPLLSDPTLETIKALGAWRTPKAQGRWNGVIPGAVLADAAGRIVDSWFSIRKLETIPELIRARFRQ